MNKKTNKTAILLAIISTLGLTSSTYAASDNARRRCNIHSDEHNDARGTAGEPKVTICHVPCGNPENKHTIHIGASAWTAHFANHEGDHLGSCDNPPESTSSQTENLVVIENCTGSYRQTLVELTQSYFDPLIINDSILDDEVDGPALAALSECLDHGDSSDSSAGNAPSTSKGQGYASYGAGHLRISACKNRDTSASHPENASEESDSSQNYHKKFSQRKAHFNATYGHGDSSLNISDSSMDNSAVRSAYQTCIATNPDYETGTDKGDAAHKYREMSGCPNASEIKTAVAAYKNSVATEARYARRPIVLKTSTLTDTRIQEAVANCVDPDLGGGTQTGVPPTSEGYTGRSGRLNWRQLTNDSQ